MHQGTSTVRSVSLGPPVAAQRCVSEGGWQWMCPYTALTARVAVDRLYVLAFERILRSMLGSVRVQRRESTTTAALMSKGQGLL